MRAPKVDAADVLLVAGAVLIGVTVWLLWPVFIYAYAGAVLILVGVLREVGHGTSG